MTRIEPKADRLVEDGWYPATISEVEEKDTKHGERLMVTFDLEPGDDTIVDITAFLTYSEHPKSNIVKWGKALFGERAFDTDEFSGVKCEIFVEEGEDQDGQPKNYIRKVRKPKEEKVKAGGKTDDGDESNFDDLPF